MEILVAAKKEKVEEDDKDKEKEKEEDGRSPEWKNDDWQSGNWASSWNWNSWDDRALSTSIKVPSFSGKKEDFIEYRWKVRNLEAQLPYRDQHKLVPRLLSELTGPVGQGSGPHGARPQEIYGA